MADKSIRSAVPPGILDVIKEHTRIRSTEAESGWRSAPHTEDTLTGHWCAKIQTGWSAPVILGSEMWRWRIEYRKFSGGNQYSSEEKPTGADGIIQVEVEKFAIEVTPLMPARMMIENVEAAVAFRKGLLFQAKRFDATERKRLLGQLLDMEHLTPNESAYFEFGPAGFRASTAADMVGVAAFTKQLAEDDFPRLGDFVADRLLECTVGVEGMYFDFDTETLYFPRENGDIARVRTELKHGLRIEVKAFEMVPFGATATTAS